MTFDMFDDPTLPKAQQPSPTAVSGSLASGSETQHVEGQAPSVADRELDQGPATAPHSPGCWSKAFDSHHQMRVGVTSIQIRAKYQLSRRGFRLEIGLQAIRPSPYHGHSRPCTSHC